MSIARIAEKIENPSVAQLLAAYPDKEKFDEAVRAGRIKPTTEAGVAANIFNRIVAAALAKQARIQGEKTVFQELTAPQGMGLGAIAPGMSQGMGQPQQPPQGLDQIPVPDQMFQPQGMAGGGIVAFQAGGDPRAQLRRPPTFTPSLPPTLQDPRVATRPPLVSVTGRPLPSLPPSAPPTTSPGIFSRGANALLKSSIGRGIPGAVLLGELFSSSPTNVGEEEQLDIYRTLLGLGYTEEDVRNMPAEMRKQIVNTVKQSQTQQAPQMPPEGQGQQTPPPPPPPPSGERPAAAPAAPTSAVPGLREQLLGRIGEAYPDLAGKVKPAEPSVKGLFQERAEAERIAGVDKRFFENEAKRIVALSDKLKGDKNEAANMRLIEAGLRIMGGESPYAFVNIGKGASEALKGFADDVKDIQKTKREYDKAERELRTAEQLYARNKSDEALKEVQRRRELAQDRNTSFQTAMMNMELKLKSLSVQEEGVRAQAAAAARPSEMERMIRLATDPNATEDQRKLARGVLERQSGVPQQVTLQLRALNDLLTSKQDQLFATKDKQAKQKIQEEINSIQGQIRSIGGLGGAGSVDPDLLRRADAILGIR